MADKSSIEWTDASWNPIRVEFHSPRWYCEKVSPACAHCYASAFNNRMGGHEYPAAGNPKASGPPPLFLDAKTLLQPLHWKRPRMIFVCSMTDLFGDWVSDAWLDRIWAVMALAKQHTFQVLTKRPERMRHYLSDWHPCGLWKGAKMTSRATFIGWKAQAMADDGVSSGLEILHLPQKIREFVNGRSMNCWLDWPLPNVWAMTSTENQHWADIRIPELLQTPAAVRGISAEPLLGELDIRPYLGENFPDALTADANNWAPLPALDWVICGGESGPKRRSMDLAWARLLRDQCQRAGVPFFFKQMGGLRPGTGRELGGREWNEYPRSHRPAL